MSRARFFAEELGGTEVALDGAQAHHLLNVRRVRPTEEVELFDGKGQVVRGRLSRAEKGLAHIEVLERYTKAQPDVQITLACAMAKGSRWNWLLEKCAELGAANIWPVIFERSVVRARPGKGQLEKWKNRCIEAAKQSGQVYLPKINQPRPLEEILRAVDGDFLGLMGTTAGAAGSILGVLEKASRPKQVVILIGPEGGLTGQEQSRAERAGYQPVFLGRSILRVETAAIAFLAVVQAWGDSEVGK